jgi:hypothetical protein
MSCKSGGGVTPEGGCVMAGKRGTQWGPVLFTHGDKAIEVVSKDRNNLKLIPYSCIFFHNVCMSNEISECFFIMIWTIHNNDMDRWILLLLISFLLNRVISTLNWTSYYS